MSTADDAWQEYVRTVLGSSVPEAFPSTEAGFKFAYQRALEDAADAVEAPRAGSDLDYWFGLISEDAGFRDGLAQWLCDRADGRNEI